MVEYIKQLVNFEEGLSADERNLLSVAFKNVIGAKRSSWRIVCSIESKAETIKSNSDFISQYRNQIEKELFESCNQVLEITSKLVKNSTDTDTKVFYYKMKGDYWRYLAEVAVVPTSAGKYDSEKITTEAQLS